MATTISRSHEDMHESYLEGSPTYAAAYARYGYRTPLTVARKFAYQHGADLDAAISEGEIALMRLTSGGAGVGTLSLLLWLGY